MFMITLVRSRPRSTNEMTTLSATVAFGAAGRAGWGAGLVASSLAFDGPQRSGAMLGAFRPLPFPSPTHLLPTTPNQRFGQTISMLGKVIPEAALHAGGALVGGVQLDVGGGDANDFVVGNVQVHLTADAAIRADRAHDLVRVSDLLGGDPLPRHHLLSR